MGRVRTAYTFAGTERELVDAHRYEQALRAWAGYLVRHIVDERLPMGARDETGESETRSG